jgi:hypothetical protein
MDPYLEEPYIWPDFHLTLAVVVRTELNKVLIPRYFARLDRQPCSDPRDKGAPFVRIVRGKDHHLVTIIEFLTPGNKWPGKDREIYLQRRKKPLSDGVNLVELDLLRTGERTLPGKPELPAADYLVLICRAPKSQEAFVWPFSIREPIPIVPIPLSPGEPDALLDLQPCMNQAYDDGAYVRELNYTEPPEPPLREPDATWARELLATKSPPEPEGDHP